MANLLYSVNRISLIAPVIIDTHTHTHTHTQQRPELLLLFSVLYSVPYGNFGCQGGNMYNAYQYVVGNEGVDSQISYSYKGRVS